MLIEVHMLKNYAPTNLNRDDTGAPKTCMFGGVQRGRISSQCLKRSWRVSPIFMEEVGRENIGTRTRKLPDLVAEKLTEKGFSEELVEAAKKKITGFGNKDGKETADGITAQVIAYSPADIEAVADQLAEKLANCSSAKDVAKLSAKDMQSAMKSSNDRAVTLDMALFGRMVTSEAFADVEAAMQVAHAVSTNRVNMESDYFTAVDDLIAESTDETGSGMIGDIDYNSSCYYIYASLDTDKLLENLKNCDDPEEIVKKAIPALIETMAFSNPSGKQNSFAGHSLPSAVLVECRERKIPVSYVNAYERPVRANGDSGIVRESVERLKDECLKTERLFGLSTDKRLWFTTENEVVFGEGEELNCASLPELIAQLPEA